MKIDEAISLLKQYIDYSNPRIPDFYTMAEACEVAIKALEKEPCADTVSMRAVIDALTKTGGIRGDALKALYDLPQVTPQKKVGRWIYHDGYIPYKHECSECGKRFGTDFNYCPNCGAKMVEQQESEGKECH